MPHRQTAARQSAIALVLAAAFAAPAHAAQPCAADAICGVKNPEDMVRTGATHWALATRLARDPAAPGGFYAVDLDRRTATALAADLSGPVAAAYAGCPGAPSPVGLLTHGLDVRMGRNGAGEAFVLNHGDRQSVEVFDLRLAADGPHLAWKGCVLTPPEASANAVVAVPGGMAVTSFGSTDKRSTADLIAARPSGFVLTWSPAVGWKRLAASEFPGDNGIAASADGRTLYVNAWGDGTLRVLDLAGRPQRTVRLGDFHPDNVHFTPEGQLLVAGQVGDRQGLLGCGKQPICPFASMVVSVDPRTLAVHPVASVPATAEFGAASVAIAYDGGVWLGSFQAERLVWAKGR